MYQQMSLFFQLPSDRFNCGIHAVLGQLQNVPEDYTAQDFRRWMARHMVAKADYFQVQTTYILLVVSQFFGHIISIYINFGTCGSYLVHSFIVLFLNPEKVCS